MTEHACILAMHKLLVYCNVPLFSFRDQEKKTDLTRHKPKGLVLWLQISFVSYTPPARTLQSFEVHVSVRSGALPAALFSDGWIKSSGHSCDMQTMQSANEAHLLLWSTEWIAPLWKWSSRVFQTPHNQNVSFFIRRFNLPQYPSFLSSIRPFCAVLLFLFY